jgi:hypothetical protein
MAGDPTLILIRSGISRIGLRDESYHVFDAGDAFIAQDKLIADTSFNNIHRHTAKVIGGQQLIALHLKHSSI